MNQTTAKRLGSESILDVLGGRPAPTYARNCKRGHYAPRTAEGKCSTCRRDDDREAKRRQRRGLSARSHEVPKGRGRVSRWF